jgi:hypothetical protein
MCWIYVAHAFLERSKLALLAYHPTRTVFVGFLRAKDNNPPTLFWERLFFRVLDFVLKNEDRFCFAESDRFLSLSLLVWWVRHGMGLFSLLGALPSGGLLI